MAAKRKATRSKRKPPRKSARPAKRRRTPRPARKPGRPTKCTPELTAAIVRRIAGGAYPEVAAQAEGIAHATFYRWMADGERPDADEVYREFRDAVLIAEAQAESDVSGALKTKAMKRDVKGAVEWLKRRARKRWGDKQEVALAESPETGAELDYDRLTQAERDRLRELLTKAAVEADPKETT